jgi:hypothetical protein
MGLPVEVNNLMMGSLGGYNIGRSLRFRSSASAKLTRTPSVSSNQRTWTWSGWVKRGTLGTAQKIFWAGYTNGATADGLVALGFTASDQLQHYVVETSVADRNNYSTSVYRDPSAWYHIVFIYDSTDATASNRQRIYVNGVQITSFAATSYVSQNYQADVNSSSFQHGIGIYGFNSTQYFDGYLAEVNFIDGQALTPSSFGAYDTNGVWQPKKYTGTYGTNGFYLPFSNTTSTTTLVQDSSGNGNNWTPNNISLTAGTTYDSMIDSPTVSASSSNYAVLNPIGKSGGTITNGNLQWASGGGDGAQATATIALLPNTGKFYCEILIGSKSSTYWQVGIMESRSVVWSGTVIAWRNDGNGGFTTYTQGDIIGITIDTATGAYQFYKNNSTTSAPSGTVTLTGQPLYFGAAQDSSGGSANYTFNFGQRPFSYTPPTGFKALNTYNLPAPSIANGAQYMAATTYTGNGTAGRVITVPNINEVGFAWVKLRSGIDDHRLANIVTGGNKHLKSNTTDAESTGTNIIQAFSSNTFTVGNDTSVNANGSTYVGWTWAANGTGVTNNSGTITSTVSASPSSGFSIATYTGTGAAAATVGHGLGVAPQFIITKMRSSSIASWNCWHTGINTNQVIYINSTSAAATPGTGINWNPTSTTFRVDPDGGYGSNASGVTYVAYCFSAVSGYSAFGKYTGNGSADGPFVFTNFRPRYLLIKRTDSASDWRVTDSSRSAYNAQVAELFPSSSAAETSTSTEYDADYLSNGFKLRSTNINSNASGGTYVWAAFSENPFKYSRGR